MLTLHMVRVYLRDWTVSAYHSQIEQKSGRARLKEVWLRLAVDDGNGYIPRPWEWT